MITFQVRYLSKAWFTMLCSAAACLMFPILVSGQTHFSSRSNTGENYSILIRTATLNGTALSSGDEIGVFTSTGLCVGDTVVTQAGNIPLVAWQDDPMTPAVDGYTDGDSMHFRFWHADTQTELPATAVYLLGNGDFGNGPYAFVDLSATFNFAPRISRSINISFDEDAIFELPLDTIVSDANDADSLLRWQISCGPHLTFVVTSNRALRLTPSPDWFGSETCTFIVTDPAGASDTTGVEAQVRSVNDLPALQLPASFSIAEDDTTKVIALDDLAADVESPDAALVWTITRDPNIAVRFDGQRRLIRLVPAQNFNGKGNIGLSVKDPDGGVATAPVPITVTPVPDSPTAAVLISPIRGDTIKTLNPVLRWQAGTDPDGDKLHYTVVYGTSPTLITQSDTATTDNTTFKIPKGLKPGNRYYWQITVSDGVTSPAPSVIESFVTSQDAKPDPSKVTDPQAPPSQFVFEQNYPNPFSLTSEVAATRIRFVLPHQATIAVRVYNTLGQLVRELFHGSQPAGFHQLVWDGRNDNGRQVSSGLYWLRLESEDFTATKKMLVLP